MRIQQRACHGCSRPIIGGWHSRAALRLGLGSSHGWHGCANAPRVGQCIWVHSRGAALRALRALDWITLIACARIKMIGALFFLYILIFTHSQYEHVEHAPVLYRRRSWTGARAAERPSGPRARPRALAGKGSSRGKFPTAQILPRAQGSETLGVSDVIRLMPRAVASRRPMRDSG
jgi:hypothetical protein